MEKIEAIKWLIAHDQEQDEWSGSGMWHSVKGVMKYDGNIPMKFLEQLLEEARNF